MIKSPSFSRSSSSSTTTNLPAAMSRSADSMEWNPDADGPDSIYLASTFPPFGGCTATPFTGPLRCGAAGAAMACACQWVLLQSLVCRLCAFPCHLQEGAYFSGRWLLICTQCHNTVMSIVLKPLGTALAGVTKLPSAPRGPSA